MDKPQDAIKEKIEGAFRDMDAHSYNNYTDESEYPITFTVQELKWLYEELNKSPYYH